MSISGEQIFRPLGGGVTEGDGGGAPLSALRATSPKGEEYNILSNVHRKGMCGPIGNRPTTDIKLTILLCWVGQGYGFCEQISDEKNDFTSADSTLVRQTSKIV